MKKIAVLLILIIFNLTSCTLSGIPDGLTKTEEEYYKYLKNNFKNIDITDDSFAALADFNEAVKDYNILLIGEAHAVAKNFDIQFYLLKNAVENHGVRYMLTEASFADSQLLNRYLQTGDISILDDLFVAYEGSFAYTQEAYNYYIDLYEYNKTLPEDKKLLFVGVDIGFMLSLSIKYLQSIMPEQESPQEILNTVNEFKRILAVEITAGQPYEKEPTIQAIKSIYNDIENNERIYSNYLGDEYFNIKFTCENVIQAENYYRSTIKSEAIRESYIFSNFVTLYEQYNDNAKYYGNWGDGHGHLVKSSVVGGKTFAAYLDKEYEATKGKVLNVLSVYYNSQHASYGNYESTDISGTYSVLIRENIDVMLHSLAKSDFSLFNLMNDDSPFITHNKDTDAITYESGAQYFLLIQNSPAANKFK